MHAGTEETHGLVHSKGGDSGPGAHASGVPSNALQSICSTTPLGQACATPPAQVAEASGTHAPPSLSGKQATHSAAEALGKPAQPWSPLSAQSIPMSARLVGSHQWRAEPLHSDTAQATPASPSAPAHSATPPALAHDWPHKLQHSPLAFGYGIVPPSAHSVRTCSPPDWTHAVKSPGLAQTADPAGKMQA